MERLTESLNGIGFCPENIECTPKCEDCEHMESMIDKLAEYEDLEEQGLLLRLPCKVGDTVWRIVPKTYKHIQSLIIESFIFDGKELLVKDNFGLVRSCETFGKTIFFTEKEAQSEAEGKLRELEE